MSDKKASNGSKGGRPSDFGEWTAGECEEYLQSFLGGDGGGLNDKELVPTRAGLALHLKTSKASLVVWSKHTDKTHPDANVSQFQDALFRLDQIQEVLLVGGGLSGDYNSGIAKLILSNHGYADKIDNISTDGSMTPKSFNEFYAKPAES